MKKIFLALIAAVLSCSSAFADANVVFFKSDGSWSQPYAHIWGGNSGSSANQTGYALKNISDKYWVYANSTTYANIIFTSASGWTNQTSNIENVTDLNGYYGNSNTGGSLSSFAPQFYGTFATAGVWAAQTLTQESGTTYKTATFTYSSSVEFGFRLVEGTSQLCWAMPKASLTASNLSTTLTGGSSNPTISGLEEGSTYHLEIDFSTLALKLVIDSTPKAKDPGVTVYYDNSGSQWTTPYIYYWSDPKPSSWPGEAMTQVDATHNIWSFQFPYAFETFEGLKFNDGASNTSVQTNNWTTAPVEGELYGSHGTGTDVSDLGKYSAYTGPETLYVIGDISDNSWISGGGIKMTKNGNVYTATNVEFGSNSSDSSNAAFNLTDYVSSSWDDVNVKAARYCAGTSADVTVTSGTAYTAVLAHSSAKNWVVDANAKYDIQFNWSTMQLTVTESAETAPSVVYIYGNLYDEGNDGWANVDGHALDGTQLNKVGDTNVYEATITLYNGSDGYGYFFLAEDSKTAWADFGNVVCYAANSDSERRIDMDGLTTTTINVTGTKNNAGNSFSVLSGDYKVSFDWDAKTITLTVVNSANEDITYVETPYTVLDSPSADAQLTAFHIGAFTTTTSATSGAIKTITAGTLENAGLAVTYSWVKYEDTSSYSYLELYASDNVSGSFPDEWTNEETGKVYKDANRTWAIDLNTSNKHTCRNFSQAFYRFYVEAGGTVAALSKNKIAPKASVKDTYGNIVALSIAVGDNTTGVDDIVVDGNQSIDDADAPVEYYNLQGIRIANPSNGIYIRRQGNKVSKEYIR